MEDHRTTLEVLSKAGWDVEKTKTSKPEEASKTIEYLGFLINTADMTVHLSEDKLESLKATVQEILSFGKRFMPAKLLASALGRMVAAEPALGSFSLIHARLAYADLEAAITDNGWKTNLVLTEEAASSLRGFLKDLSRYNGAPIKSTRTRVSVLSLIGQPSDFITEKVIPNHVREKDVKLWCSDASAVAVCAYSVEDSKELYFIGKLTPTEMTLSSGHRELLAVKKCLTTQFTSKGPWKAPVTVYWMTDSANLVSFLTRGSSKEAIQRDVLEVLRTCRNLKCNLVPIHLRREDPRIQVADAGSKAPDSDDWSIDDTTFSYLSQKYGPFSVDLFADESNHRTPKFYSDFASPSSSGVNAFAHSWSNEDCFACPPVNLVIQTIKKIAQEPSQGILVIPKWSTARFWPFVFPDGKNLGNTFSSYEEICPTIIQNQRARSPLAGRTSFNFLAIAFSLK